MRGSRQRHRDEGDQPRVICAPAVWTGTNTTRMTDDKCILFHCGTRAGQPHVAGRHDHHFILMDRRKARNNFGCNQGRLKPMDFTFTSLMTEAGRVNTYLGEAKITEDFVPPEFFGVAGVGRHLLPPAGCAASYGRHGHRHHVSLTPGHAVTAERSAGPLPRFRHLPAATGFAAEWSVIG